MPKNIAKGRPFVVDPADWRKKAWDFLVCALVVVNAFGSPYAIAFAGRGDSAGAGAGYWLVTCVLCLDLALGFRTAIRHRSLLTTDPKAIAARYLRGSFALDLAAALPLVPLGLLAFGSAPAARFLALARLLGLYRFSRVIKTLEKSLRLNPSIMRLAGMVFWFAIAAHLLALGWIGIGAAAASDLGFGIVGDLAESVPHIERYLRSLYFMTTTMATIGYGDISPRKDAPLELAYTIFVQIVGVGMYGYIIGNVSTLLANLDVTKAAFRRRMDEINAFMRTRRLPPELRSKIRGYYDYMWEVHRSTGEEPLLGKLPRSLGLEVSLYLNREILEKVPFFKDADEVFVREIVTELDPLTFVPGDYIVRKGEYGDRMYFISSGTVDVIKDEPTVLATLRSGSPFGEMSLIEGGARNASVVAKDYCDVYELSKESFDRLRSRHPAFDARVREIVAERGRPGGKG